MYTYICIYMVFKYNHSPALQNKKSIAMGKLLEKKCLLEKYIKV
jgi:hypothetical protein